jgi:hypothetical protein
MHSKIENKVSDSIGNSVKPFFQPKPSVNQAYDGQGADKVMRTPIGDSEKNAFFKAAPNLVQRETPTTTAVSPPDPSKTFTDGASVVKDELGKKPGFDKWKDQQTDALKKALWDTQSTEFKAGIIGYGLGSLGILGTVLASDPRLRTDTIKLLDDKNIALPLSLIPHHEYFPLSSFKYKLPQTTGAPTTFNTEFEFKPYLDMMHEKWSFIPKTDLTLGLSSGYSAQSGFGLTGGSIKLKFGGGIINLDAFVNQTLPATPMLVSGPGESPTWVMRTLPGQFDDQLPKGSGVFLTVDVLRLPELFKRDGPKKP